MPGSSWPISKRDLAPYYRRASQLEKTDDLLQASADILREADILEPELGRESYACHFGYCPEKKFARLFLPLINSSTIPIVLHANVCTVRFSQDSTNVEFSRISYASGTCWHLPCAHLRLLSRRDRKCPLHPQSKACTVGPIPSRGPFLRGSHSVFRRGDPQSRSISAWLVLWSTTGVEAVSSEAKAYARSSTQA